MVSNTFLKGDGVYIADWMRICEKKQMMMTLPERRTVCDFVNLVEFYYKNIKKRRTKWNFPHVGHGQTRYDIVIKD